MGEDDTVGRIRTSVIQHIVSMRESLDEGITSNVQRTKYFLLSTVDTSTLFYKEVDVYRFSFHYKLIFFFFFFSLYISFFILFLLYMFLLFIYFFYILYI